MTKKIIENKLSICLFFEKIIYIIQKNTIKNAIKKLNIYIYMS